MNIDYTKDIQDHLDEIRIFWEAPEDFWTAVNKFALDSNVLRDLLESAFIKGANSGYINGLVAGRKEAFDLYSKAK